MVGRVAVMWFIMSQVTKGRVAQPQQPQVFDPDSGKGGMPPAGGMPPGGGAVGAVCDLATGLGPLSVHLAPPFRPGSRRTANSAPGGASRRPCRVLQHDQELRARLALLVRCLSRLFATLGCVSAPT